MGDETETVALADPTPPRRAKHAMRGFACCLPLTAVLVAAPLAAAKEFEPGSLQLCRASDCVWVPGIAPEIGLFLYGESKVRPAAHPGPGMRLQVRFSDGGLLGILAPARAPDRFSSGGGTINEGRIDAARWYELPPALAVPFSRAAAELAAAPVAASAREVEARQLEPLDASSPAAAGGDSGRGLPNTQRPPATGAPDASQSKWPVLVATIGGIAAALAAAACWRLRRPRPRPA